ncbi:putative ATP-dependent DNA helicase YoaA [Gammaproteobacteria bacterium]|nr:putative ATP-dependent DNA helicase YoaA [Gammaproteobacteria bacterium]
MRRNSTVQDRFDSFFLDDSPLRGALAGFAPRPEQLQMARLVRDAMAGRRHLAIEAGAGTGKTLAYLVPALLSGQRVIIATGTRTLQDQLYHRDLPVVAAAMGRPAVVAQLKGRANYLCRYRLARLANLPDTLGSGARRDLRRITEWAGRTQSGDIAEAGAVAEDSPLWPQVTSTADNCLGSRCPEFDACHVVAVRKRAAAADIAIVNHHLLLADMALQEDGFGQLLPGAEVVVVDEAHRFPETAQAWFDVTLRSRQLEDLVRDTATEAQQAAALDGELRGCLDALLGTVRDAQAAAPAGSDPLAMAEAPAFSAALLAMAEALAPLGSLLAERAALGPGLGRCAERTAALTTAAGRIADWQAQADLCWVQGGREAFAVHLTPLDASRQMSEMLGNQHCTWIFTSATLAVGDDFSHFAGRLGLEPLETRRIDSPFDYARCARLYLPAGLPAPEAPDYLERCVAALEPVLETSRGRAFLLFTSRRSLQRAAELLGRKAQGHALLVQGSAPRSRLLEAFARTDNAVLLGTATFWEGVDIRGPALVVVAIDRLPFASPGDPFLQARLELVRRAGGDPFRDYQLPQAVLALRQGVGRLIRGTTDYGIVVICDPRLSGRGYGRVFRDSLPPMPVVRSAAEACDFLRQQEAGA